MHYQVDIEYAYWLDGDETHVWYWTDSEPDLCAIWDCLHGQHAVAEIRIETWTGRVTRGVYGRGEWLSIWPTLQQPWLYEYVEERP